MRFHQGQWHCRISVRVMGGPGSPWGHMRLFRMPSTARWQRPQGRKEPSAIHTSGVGTGTEHRNRTITMIQGAAVCFWSWRSRTFNKGRGLYPFRLVALAARAWQGILKANHQVPYRWHRCLGRCKFRQSSLHTCGRLVHSIRVKGALAYGLAVRSHCACDHS